MNRMNSVYTYSGLDSYSVKRGEAKWILYPLGVKVRIIIVDGDDNPYDYPVQNDYAGIESLKVVLEDLNYVSSITSEDKIDWRIESLDPDWKSKHLEHLIDIYGEPDSYYEWFCEKETYESADDKVKYCSKVFRENKELSQKFDASRVVEVFCRSTGRGSAIPSFLAEYHKDVKWIESHLVHALELKSKRGTNPNSLKNLKQNRQKEEEIY